jgi:hypothetical protein
MRAIIRYIATGVWLLFAVVVGTVFRQNIEEFASDHGWNDALSQWWLGMTSASYSTFLLLGFALLTGAVATLWLDAAIRKLVSNSRRNSTRHLSFRFDPTTNEYDERHCIGIDGYHLLTDERERETAPSDPKLSKKKTVLTLIYKHPVNRPDFSVAASHPILFQVTCNSDGFSYVDIDWQNAKEPVDVDIFIFSPSRYAPLHNWEYHWQEVTTAPTGAIPSPQLPLDTATGTQPKIRHG